MNAVINRQNAALLGLGANDTCDEPWLGCPDNSTTTSSPSKTTSTQSTWDKVKDAIGLGTQVYTAATQKTGTTTVINNTTSAPMGLGTKVAIGVGIVGGVGFIAWLATRKKKEKKAA